MQVSGQDKEVNMNKFAPWEIVHIDLGKSLQELPAISQIQGLYIVFWFHNLPLGHKLLPVEKLPLTVSELTRIALETASRGAHEGEKEVATEGLSNFCAYSSLQELLALLEKKQSPESVELQNPSVSVVICTRNRLEALARAVDSILCTEQQPDEIIVVDNAPSSDVTRKLVAGLPGIRYVLEPRRGLDVARNAGVQHSKGDIVAFIDDDVIVHPNWLNAIKRSFVDPAVMAVTGLVLPAELKTEAQYFFETYWGFNRGYQAKVFDLRYFEHKKSGTVSVWKIGAGANMAFRRAVFSLVGGFDERLDVGAAGCSGDSELWYRILAEGWKCRYEPAAVAFHYHRENIEDVEEQIFNYMRGHVAALCIQFENYHHFGNIRRVVNTLPKRYLKSISYIRKSGYHPSHLTLKPEIAGYFSGIFFYLGRIHWRNLISNKLKGDARRFDNGFCRINTDESLISQRAGTNNLTTQIMTEQETASVTETVPVSIIITCYDQASFLDEAIRSALHQTCKATEIMVVDDGSEDHTSEVALSFPEVKYLHKRNGGLADARNAGIMESQNPFLVFLDADDRLLPVALEAGLRAFHQHPECALVFGDYNNIDIDGFPIDGRTLPGYDLALSLGQLHKNYEDNNHYWALLQRNYIGMHASVMYCREALTTYGGFNTKLGACEDYDLYLRVARCSPIYFHGEMVAEYRRHSGTMSSNAKLMLDMALTVLSAQKKFVKRDNNLLQAYHKGMKFWKAYYGGK
jgi:glycosyltransferase involved in cell wall biosynthesis